ncbi:MAG: hypothetical protein ABI877_19660 [Gemmatimonadaceae bacterium]
MTAMHQKLQGLVAATLIGMLSAACGTDPIVPTSPSIAALEANADVTPLATSNWELTILPVLPGGTWTQATSINDGGTIVGYGNVGGGAVHAFKYYNGVITDLGKAKGYPTTRALGINRNGEVVGVATTTARPRLNTAVRWTAAGQISPLPGTDTVGGSIAYAISTPGVVVGSFRTKRGEWHAARWNRTRLDDLNPWLQAGYHSEARSVNASGEIVGFGDFPTTYALYTGVKWDAAMTPTYLVPLASDPFYADSSRAYDININGDWVGWSSYPNSGAVSTYISSIKYDFSPPSPGVIGAPESALSDRLRMVGTVLQTSGHMRAFTSRYLYNFASYGDILPIPFPYTVSQGAEVNTCGRVVGYVKQFGAAAPKRAALWTRFARGPHGKVYPCD